MGGSDLPDLKQEFNSLPHEEERYQWLVLQILIVPTVNFICFKAAPFLDRQYTVFEKVIRVWTMWIK